MRLVFSAKPMTSLSCRLFIIILLFSVVPNASAAKTDVVVLKNGDKVTGEVKGLLRGRLELSTNSMGTVFIDWVDIQAIISNTDQSVELSNGQRFFGPLEKSDESEMLKVQTEQGTVGVGTLDVVSMYPVEASFWERLDFSAGIGFGWDKASDVGRYTVVMSSEYRNPRFITRGEISGEITTQTEREDTRRANANLLHMQFHRNKRFIGYFASIERNDELGISRRALGGAGYGWVPIRSYNNWFALTAGMDVNHEIPTEGESETNLEAVGMVNYEYYRFSEPERNFKSSLTVFPSLTDFGRWRADFSTDLELEFFRDFSWVFGLFYNYDSDPISDSKEASKSDYGFSSRLEYDF